jgi:hypothetical protein
MKSRNCEGRELVPREDRIDTGKIAWNQSSASATTRGPAPGQALLLAPNRAKVPEV